MPSNNPSFLSIRKKTIGPIVLLILINLAAFANKIHGQFLADDFSLLALAESFMFSKDSIFDLFTFHSYLRPIPIIF